MQIVESIARVDSVSPTRVRCSSGFVPLRGRYMLKWPYTIASTAHIQLALCHWAAHTCLSDAVGLLLWRSYVHKRSYANAMPMHIQVAINCCGAHTCSSGLVPLRCPCVSKWPCTVVAPKVPKRVQAALCHCGAHTCWSGPAYTVVALIKMYKWPCAASSCADDVSVDRPKKHQGTHAVLECRRQNILTGGVSADQ